MADRLWASDRDTALGVINQAIQAQGGEQRLVKSRLRQRQANGVRFLQDAEQPFTTDLVMALPDRFHDTIDIGAEGQKKRLLQILNGDKGWCASDGEATEMGPEEVNLLREEAYVVWLTTLVPLRDPAFELAPLPEIKVNGQPASGVKVSSKDHAAVQMFFDKQTGFLIRVERRFRIAGLAVTGEYLFTDYKDYDGLKLPSKQTDVANGSKETELSITSYKFPEKVDDNLFGRP